MYKTRMKRLQKKIITRIVADYYKFGNDPRAKEAQEFWAAWNEFYFEEDMQKVTQEQYNKLTIEELSIYDPYSHILLEIMRKKWEQTDQEEL